MPNQPPRPEPSVEGTADTTERIVLYRADQIKEEGVTHAWFVVLNGSGKPLVLTGTKAACIEKASGGKPGTYKAVSLRAWKGTRIIEIPEKPEPVSRWEDE